MYKTQSKTQLCRNFMNYGFCNYKSDCTFAHSITEQRVSRIRSKVYAIINNNIDLSNINLVEDKRLFDELLVMTSSCNRCMKRTCQGGLNCRDGAMSDKYRICKDDLTYGNCNKECKYIHLTDKGLIPYNIRKYRNMTRKCDRDICGTFVTEKFLLSRLCDDEESSDEFENDTDEIIEYLNNGIDSDDSLDESIFS